MLVCVLKMNLWHGNILITVSLRRCYVPRRRAAAPPWLPPRPLPRCLRVHRLKGGTRLRLLVGDWCMERASLCSASPCPRPSGCAECPCGECAPLHVWWLREEQQNPETWLGTQEISLIRLPQKLCRHWDSPPCMGPNLICGQGRLVPRDMQDGHKGKLLMSLLIWRLDRLGRYPRAVSFTVHELLHSRYWFA
jgi:hypothetical protein